MKRMLHFDSDTHIHMAQEHNIVVAAVEAAALQRTEQARLGRTYKQDMKCGQQRREEWGRCLEVERMVAM